MVNEYLCFVKFIGTDIDGYNSYEFLFTDNIDEFWGENFEYMPCGLCNELIPNEDSFNKVFVLRTEMKLELIQNSCCFSMQDCIDRCVSMCYENIEIYDEYPENGRLVLHFGESYEEVILKLANKNLLLKEKDLDD